MQVVADHQHAAAELGAQLLDQPVELRHAGLVEPLRGLVGGEVAEGEGGMVMRRADHLQDQRPRRGRVVAEPLRPVHLARPVDAGDGGPDAGAFDTGCGHARHRVDDLAIAGATAENPTERVLDLGLGGRRIGAQKRDGGHHHARCADPALGRTVPEERLGKPCENRIILTDSGERLDPALGGLCGGGDTGADRGAVQKHGAGTAVAGVAADLDLGAAEVTPQHPRQALRPARMVHLAPVQGESDPVHGADPSSIRRASAMTASRR